MALLHTPDYSQTQSDLQHDQTISSSLGCSCGNQQGPGSAWFIPVECTGVEIAHEMEAANWTCADILTFAVHAPFSLRDVLQAFRSREANKLEKKADVPQSTEEPSSSGEMPVVQVLKNGLICVPIRRNSRTLSP